MKVMRELKSPALYSFAKEALPNSLVVGTCSDGYSRGYYVYQKGCKPWFGRGDPIAELGQDEIYLLHHNYFSDMEALAMAYENATGFEVTLRYRQYPKEEPIK